MITRRHDGHPVLPLGIRRVIDEDPDVVGVLEFEGVSDREPPDEYGGLVGSVEVGCERVVVAEDDRRAVDLGPSVGEDLAGVQVFGRAAETHPCAPPDLLIEAGDGHGRLVGSDGDPVYTIEFIAVCNREPYKNLVDVFGHREVS